MINGVYHWVLIADEFCSIVQTIIFSSYKIYKKNNILKILSNFIYFSDLPYNKNKLRENFNLLKEITKINSEIKILLKFIIYDKFKNESY